MAAPSYSLPTIGQDNSTEDPKVRTALSDLKTLLTDGIDDSNISTGGVGSGSLASGAALANLGSATVTDAKLASPNNSAYKTVYSQGGNIPALQVVGKYGYGADGSIFQSGAATNGAVGVQTIYIDDADRTVGGLTQYMRVRMQLATNATAIGTVTITGGLFPITSVAGAANTLVYTLGTVIAGTTVAYVSPSASTLYPTSAATGFSTDVAISGIADGHYVLGLNTSVNTTAASSRVGVSLQLQTRNA